MDNTELKIFAGSIITESKLSKSAKLQLLNFLQNEATDAQVKALLMDGKIIRLDEQAEEIVNERFKVHPRYKQLNEGAVKTIFGFLAIGVGGWAVYRAIRAFVSEKSRRCGALAIGRSRDVCLWKVRAEEANKMISFLKKSSANCKQSKNPSKCVQQVQSKIAKYEKQRVINQQKINAYKSKGGKSIIKTQQGLQRAADKKGKFVG